MCFCFKLHFADTPSPLTLFGDLPLTGEALGRRTKTKNLKREEKCQVRSNLRFRYRRRSYATLRTPETKRCKVDDAYILVLTCFRERKQRLNATNLFSRFRIVRCVFPAVVYKGHDDSEEEAHHEGEDECFASASGFGFFGKVWL